MTDLWVKQDEIQICIHSHSNLAHNVCNNVFAQCAIVCVHSTTNKHINAVKKLNCTLTTLALACIISMKKSGNWEQVTFTISTLRTPAWMHSNHVSSLKMIQTLYWEHETQGQQNQNVSFLKSANYRVSPVLHPLININYNDPYYSNDTNTWVWNNYLDEGFQKWFIL